MTRNLEGNHGRMPRLVQGPDRARSLNPPQHAAVPWPSLKSPAGRQFPPIIQFIHGAPGDTRAQEVSAA
ncbi:hypothetical protein AARI_28810 [Glutamicibacter arilaitensis Re117]|uniref:Uncharacterized protein n=1 Tax=Glutamicibacter arilaitensis (strain DSM 16368 / CIP 108037 / IAM 15318 / JCM 13566 / NCIMB 14258 / Re117) TaxID=861360 RepID=A0ABP1U7X1_GLUAR|nr:hypothetical protein AARI_28810 [Glutamicibacter arilaitensis Re117]